MSLKLSLIKEIIEMISECNISSLKNLENIRKDVLEGLYHNESPKLDQDHEKKRKRSEEITLKQCEKNNFESEGGSSSKKTMSKRLSEKAKSDNEDNEIHYSKKSKNEPTDNLKSQQKKSDKNIKSRKDKKNKEFSIIQKGNMMSKEKKRD